jgi:glycosyltransferase involved in cell wall biosynthesis
MNPKAKILIVAKNQFGYLTDYFYWSKYLLPEFEVYFLHYCENKEIITLDGVKVIQLRRTGKKYLDIPRLLFRYMQISSREKINLTFIEYFKYCSVFRIFFWKRMIVDIRSGYIGLDESKRVRNNNIISFEASLYARITIVSESLKKELKIAGTKCVTMPLGGMDFNIANSCSELNLLYVGTLDQRRIYNTVLGLSAFSKNRNIDIHYNIIGSGSMEEEDMLIRTIHETGLDHIVHFLGPVKQTDLGNFFSNTSIGIVYVPKIPAYENQPPTKLFEFIINGIPVIATSTKEISRYINPDNGVLIEDNPLAFSKGLESIISQMTQMKSETIKESLKAYTWESLVRGNLTDIIHANLSCS